MNGNLGTLRVICTKVLDDAFSNYLGFWEDEVNVRRALDILAKEWKINSATDWMSISSNELKKKNLATPLKHYGGMLSMLMKIYPELGWNEVHKLASF